MASINRFKFLESDFTGQDISSLSDTPSADGMSAAQLKARFDQIPKMMIALDRFNDLIDALLNGATGDSGASNIGIALPSGLATTVQDAIDALRNAISQAGYGDMLKADYDINNVGIVDNAQRLGGQLPAYYVPESGSNANGSYIKFQDGTMICTKTITVNTSISRAFGSVYITETATSLGSWAATFTARPNTQYTTSSASGGNVTVLSATTSSASSAGAVYVMSPTSSTALDRTIDAVGIGRWK